MKIKVYNMDIKVDARTADLDVAGAGCDGDILPVALMLAGHQDDNGNPVRQKHYRESENYSANYLNNQKTCELYDRNVNIDIQPADERDDQDMYTSVAEVPPELFNWHTPVDGAYTPSPTESVVIDVENNNLSPDLQGFSDGDVHPALTYCRQTSVDVSGRVQLQHQTVDTPARTDLAYTPWYLLWWHRSVAYCTKLTYKLAHLLSVMCWYGQLAKKKKLQNGGAPIVPWFVPQPCGHFIVPAGQPPPRGSSTNPGKIFDSSRVGYSRSDSFHDSNVESPEPCDIEEDAESGYHTGDSMLQHKARAINAIHNAAYKKQIQQTPKGKPAGGIWSPSKVTPPGGAQPIPKPPPSQRTLNRQELAGRIEAFNKNQHGLPMTMTEEKCATSADSCPCYQGFIRVYMRLMRPISMVLPAKSPNLNNVNDGSLGGHASLDRQSLEQDGGEVTSFYLPKDTTKAIHITSETTAHEVIKVLLTKFYITDNPHKFALYEKHTSSDGEVTLHRLADNDQPLVMCLGWTAEGLNNHKFVLQDNDTEEIMWDAFSTPELDNFLRILTREENEYLEQVRSKYQLLRIQMNQRIKELLIEKQSMRESVQPLSDEPRDGVFV